MVSGAFQVSFVRSVISHRFASGRASLLHARTLPALPCMGAEPSKDTPDTPEPAAPPSTMTSAGEIDVKVKSGQFSKKSADPVEVALAKYDKNGDGIFSNDECARSLPVAQHTAS